LSSARWRGDLYGDITTDVVETTVTSWTLGNHLVGVLALAGDDVTPTVLHYFGCDVPADVDREPITEAFDVDLGRVSTRPPPEAGRPVR